MVQETNLDTATTAVVFIVCGIIIALLLRDAAETVDDLMSKVEDDRDEV